MDKDNKKNKRLNINILIICITLLIIMFLVLYFAVIKREIYIKNCMMTYYGVGTNINMNSHDFVDYYDVRKYCKNTY